MSDTRNKIGKYEIQGGLGAGRMGVVYQGWDPAIAREVAIKGFKKNTVPPSESEKLLNRLRQEARAAGRLVHPRIVQIYDYLEDENSAYIIMELVNGKTLAHYLKSKDAFGLREILQIVAQTLDGIGYAHTQGVVHRDLNAANIMINNDGRIKISDFGIARFDSSTPPPGGDLAGTPAYMSPEQLKGEETDCTTDLYAIGVIAYELLTGKRPFTSDLPDNLRQVENIPFVKPSTLNPELPPELDTVLGRALAKDRADRFQTAAEFSAAFRAAIEAALARTEHAKTAALPDAGELFEFARVLQNGQTDESGIGMPAGQPMDSPIHIDSGARKANLLIVDDEERVLTALKSLFGHSYHVFATTDANKALDILACDQMHVIISDQRMPVMQGAELLRRSREISPRSVRILLTGYSDLAAIAGSINDGEVYRFISKPWDNQALQTIVAEAATIALELADTRTTSVVLPETMSAGVLVVDRDEEVFRITRELLGGLCPVLYANDTESALNMLKEHEIAVVVADVLSSQEQLTTLLMLLKQEYPQILSIVITKAKDAELLIDLINQAQIFRILHKPINVATLTAQVRAALQRYLSFEQTPQLVKAHKVESSEQLRSSGFALSILNKLRFPHA